MQEAGASHNLRVPWSGTWGYCLRVLRTSGSSLRPASEMAGCALPLSWSRLACREETNPALVSIQPTSAPVLAAAASSPGEAPSRSGSTLRAAHWWLGKLPGRTDASCGDAASSSQPLRKASCPGRLPTCPVAPQRLPPSQASVGPMDD